MKKANGDIMRLKYVEVVSGLLGESEDIVRIGTGSIAFPIVAEDGEEGWIEVDIKVPKWTDDDDGYAKAEEYRLKCEETAEKKRIAEAEKAKKIAKSKAKREKVAKKDT